MANPHKGEVELVAGEATYTLQYSIDALCSMEAALDKNFTAIAAEMSNPARISVSMVRQLLYSGLQERHPELTLKEAGELIPAAGGHAEGHDEGHGGDPRSLPGCEGNQAGPSAGAAPGWDWPALLTDWVACGLDPDAFWSKTPRQVSLIFAGKQAQFTREHNDLGLAGLAHRGPPAVQEVPQIANAARARAQAAIPRPNAGDRQTMDLAAWRRGQRQA
ncbi:hypothetical protein [Bradyrhizobium sp. B039]|uniref:hypothetical protein n=1 Tax=Bradyrhizobium sp. B039 TaxID=3140239 RepID=UPI0031846205